MNRRDVLVVGGGAAGSAAAKAIATLDPSLGVTVVAGEQSMPYNRTTINKGLLSGVVDDAEIMLPGMDGVGVEWMLGTKAVALDAERQTVHLDTGQAVEAAAIVIACGTRPRPLEAQVDSAAWDRVVCLRTTADTHHLRRLLGSGRSRVVIVGAGLVGSETAGTLTAGGHHVTLLDPGELPLLRHVGPTVAAWVARTHRSAGVDLRARTRANGVHRRGDHVEVTVSDGSHLAAELVLVAIGAEPDTLWLENSGVRSPSGSVLVDDQQRVVGFPGLYAAGDVASVPLGDDRHRPIEHWSSAIEQGDLVASTVVADFAAGGDGAIESPQRVPLTYSTYVHGTKLTILGDSRAAVGDVLILGRPGDARFATALTDAHGRIVGGVGVGGARAVNRLRPLVERRAHRGQLT